MFHLQVFSPFRTFCAFGLGFFPPINLCFISPKGKEVLTFGASALNSYYSKEGKAKKQGI